jgi:flavin-dependent thymidylate synthase
MQATLFEYTGKGSPDPARAAANALVFTKSTRLKMNPDLYAQVEAMTDDEIRQELEYMANTIPSSWEFCHYSFIITGVSRGFTHQFVRTRTGAYAQQTMRILDVSDFEYITGPTVLDGGARQAIYDETMEHVNGAYAALLETGAAIEDARGVLPTNISTNICADFNLRTLSELFRKRASTRTQGEYRDVIDAMKAAVIEVHPWTALFFERSFDVAAAELEAMINEVFAHGGGWVGPVDETRIKMIKLIDQMRTMV